MYRKYTKKMNWDDTGYLISKNRYSENSIIAEIFCIWLLLSDDKSDEFTADICPVASC